MKGPNYFKPNLSKIIKLNKFQNLKILFEFLYYKSIKLNEFKSNIILKEINVNTKFLIYKVFFLNNFEGFVSFYIFLSKMKIKFFIILYINLNFLEKKGYPYSKNIIFIFFNIINEQILK